MLKEIIKSARESMQKSIENFRHELTGIRTGKANPALLDVVRVNYYGQLVPLRQVANIAVPDPKLITVQPWDKSLIQEIEKAIQSSELGLNPLNDGGLIRIPIPPLTEERRKDLVKVVKRMAEETRVAIRNVRRDANDRTKKLEREHKISEDEMHKNHEEIQEITNTFISEVDEIFEAKEKEIMEI